MELHPVSVAGFDGSLEELAQLVFRMRYDKVVEFLNHSEEEIRRQAEGDKKIDRRKLYLLLNRAKNVIQILASTFQDMVDGPCKQTTLAEKKIRGESK